MANKLKAEVHVNQATGSDITLEMTPEQTSTLFDRFMTGATAHVNLKTPTSNGYVKDDPEAYAQ